MYEQLTKEERATNFETMLHIQLVQQKLNFVIRELIKRGEEHDQSKLDYPEVKLFAEYTPKLAATTYGSPEYEELRKQLAPALAHHYAKNRHHPEHWDRGIADMSLVDIVEMFCDWLAATQRHHDGNIHRSIEHNTKRFCIAPQLQSILENTANFFRV